MLTAEDTPVIAEELASAFHELIRGKPGVVEQFWQSFARRAKKADLPESGTEAWALENVLAGLLSSTFQVQKHANFAQSTSDPRIPESFLRTLDSALERLPHTHPLSLLLFKKHVLSRGCTAEQGLTFLLCKYAANEAVYPY